MTLREFILSSQAQAWQGYPKAVAGCITVKELYDEIKFCLHPKNDDEAEWFQEILIELKRLLDSIEDRGDPVTVVEYYTESVRRIYRKILDELEAEATEAGVKRYLAYLQVATFSTRLLMDLIAAERGLPQAEFEFSVQERS